MTLTDIAHRAIDGLEGEKPGTFTLTLTTTLNLRDTSEGAKFWLRFPGLETKCLATVLGHDFRTSGHVVEVESVDFLAAFVKAARSLELEKADWAVEAGSEKEEDPA